MLWTWRLGPDLNALDPGRLSTNPHNIVFQTCNILGSTYNIIPRKKKQRYCNIRNLRNYEGYNIIILTPYISIFTRIHYNIILLCY